MQLRFVPSPVAVPQDAYRQPAPAITPVEQPGEGNHPVIAQLGSPPNRGWAADLSPVQHQNNRTHPRRIGRPAILDPWRRLVQRLIVTLFAVPSTTTDPVTTSTLVGVTANGSPPGFTLVLSVVSSVWRIARGRFT